MLGRRAFSVENILEACCDAHPLRLAWVATYQPCPKMKSARGQPLPGPCDAHPLQLAWVATQELCLTMKGVKDTSRNDDKQYKPQYGNNERNLCYPMG